MTPHPRSTTPHRRRAALLLAASLAVAACGTGGTTDPDAGAGPPLVVVTTTILGDVVANVAGDDATVEVLMPLGADPHEFEASAQQAALLRDADLVVANGLGLEEGLLDTLEAAEADGVRVFEIGPLLDPLPYAGPDVHDEDEETAEGDDHEEGTDHAHENGLDAHVWMDPVRMARAVDLVAVELDQVAGGDVLPRAAAYRAELEALHEEIESMIDTIPPGDRTLVTNHFALGYYADRYGLEMLGTVIPAASTQAETSAAEFAGLVDLIRREGVPAIFASTTEPTALAESIAAEVGREVRVIELYTGSLGEDGSGAETYVGMMRVSTERIVAGLGS